MDVTDICYYFVSVKYDFLRLSLPAGGIGWVVQRLAFSQDFL
jgi:hypothetical protein